MKILGLQVGPTATPCPPSIQYASDKLERQLLRPEIRGGYFTNIPAHAQKNTTVTLPADLPTTFAVTQSSPYSTSIVNLTF